jgi:hypothetical protein
VTIKYGFQVYQVNPASLLNILQNISSITHISKLFLVVFLEVHSLTVLVVLQVLWKLQLEDESDYLQVFSNQDYSWQQLRG